jgi:transposase InsO family protein
VASGLFPQQTVVEVAHGLPEGVLQYGVPQVLVCDNGSQFTDGEFRRICPQIAGELLYAPKYSPQCQGKLARFFRTTRQEMDHATALERARPLHDLWIAHSHHHRVPRGVVDGHGQAHVPQFRFPWKPSAAKSLPAG